MEPETLARKLAPLRPEQVAAWRKRRAVSTTDARQALDQALFRMAMSLLGNSLSQPLLSLPPQVRIRGKINLGQVLYERPKWQAGISRAELLQNLAIFGRSGAGKTNTVFHLIEQLSRQGIPWLFWDWKRTARHLLPRLKRKATILTPGRTLAPLAFNPFIPPPGAEVRIYINQVIDIMASAFTLGERRVRLAFSGERITRVKDALLERGWLVAEQTKVGKQLVQRLSIPPRARELLGELLEIQAERVAHDYWQRLYASQYLDAGYAVSLETERAGGRVDVLARRAEQRIGIEIETGKSDVVGNVKNCLRTGFSKVVVIAADRRALAVVERKLGEAGLLLGSRVEVVCAGTGTLAAVLPT